MPVAMLVLRIAVALVGVLIVGGTLLSAIVTFVLPRAQNTLLTSIVFQGMQQVFKLALLRTRTYNERDAILALFSPITLLVMPVVWLTLVTIGYGCIYWALGVNSLYDAFRISGSSVLTLGFATTEGWVQTVLEFTQATLGLVLVALLIAYLPTMYSAFSKREAAVTLLEVRAGSPPSATEMINRFHRIHGLQSLGDLWAQWETWFAEMEESHTSLAPLVFFRSPQPDRSWVTAVGVVLDTAALVNSAVDTPHDPRADLCIRAGYLALRRISDFFQLDYNRKPHFGDPIGITRAEFDAVCSNLSLAGVPLKGDREKAWRDFAGWRVNYDDTLRMLAAITMAPPAPWSSDRPLAPRTTGGKSYPYWYREPGHLKE